MKVLVVGKGGREHSVVMHLANGTHATEIYAAPGNDGMKKQATCVPIDVMDIDGLVQFALEKRIDLTIVGPENPLNAGIADAFQQKGLKVFAPTKAAAMLEGSKDFAKKFMMDYDIPTANYESFSKVEAARNYIKEKGAPIVIKADGLAEGKGVIVAQTTEEALEAVDHLMVDGAYEGAGRRVVVEEFLEGPEFSLIAFVHENNVYPMLPARDHKRAYDDNQGPNTGGMGAFAPVPDVTKEIIDYTTTHILEKAAEGLMQEGRPFTGILYAGLMQTETGTKVIEFNTRFGDPETQVVLPLLENDLVQVMLDCLDGKDPELMWKDASCVGTVLASKGYPEQYEKGVMLPNEQPGEEDVFVVHAGTKSSGDGYVSNGGRVLLVGALADGLTQAREKVYQYMHLYKDNENYYYRTDIAKDVEV